MCTQMNAKKEIKIFREIANVDIFKEYKQLNDGPMTGKPAVAPFYPDGLTLLYKNKTLEAANFIKEKHCGNIKGKTCENGINQRKYLKPDDIVYVPISST